MYLYGISTTMAGGNSVMENKYTAAEVMKD